MKIMSVLYVGTVVALAVMVQYTAANFLDGLGLLQSYYGAIAPPAAPALPPAPAPAPACFPYAMPVAMPPPPPPPPAPVLPPSVAFPPCAPVDSSKSCCCHHPSCLSLLKPCIHAKLLNLKKKLIEKKLAHLLACCAQFNSHLCAPSC